MGLKFFSSPVTPLHQKYFTAYKIFHVPGLDSISPMPSWVAESGYDLRSYFLKATSNVLPMGFISIGLKLVYALGVHRRKTSHIALNAGKSNIRWTKSNIDRDRKRDLWYSYEIDVKKD